MIATNSYIIPKWPAPLTVKAYTTTRQGGVSSPPYDSFNLAAHVGDNIDDVNLNREKLKSILTLPNDPCWLNQTHSNKAIYLTERLVNDNADAAITSKPNIVCAVLTADCLPILLCDLHGTEVAAIHAGWQGLLAGIIEETVMKMHSKPQNITAWLGPAIGSKEFVVGNDMLTQFSHAYPESIAAFTTTFDHKYLLDIYLLAKQRLAFCGIKETHGGEYCSYADHKLFFSYRRDLKTTGRMATLIWLTA